MSKTSLSAEQPPVTPGLRHECLRLAWYCQGSLVAGALLLGAAWHWSGALQWLLQTTVLWVFLSWQAHRRLSLNRPTHDAPMYADLGWATRLTLLRGWLIAMVGGFLLQPWPADVLLAWLPGTLYCFAAVLDRVDGYVARRTRHTSLLGTELDTVADALGMAVASLLAVAYGQVHASYLLLGLAYYAFQGGMLWRRRQGLALYDLPPSRHRRAWAGFQMGFLAVALWPLFPSPITRVAGFAFMLPALIGFSVDWLSVSGRISRQDEAVNRRFDQLAAFSVSVLQPALRVVIVVALALTLWRSGFPAAPGSSAVGGDLIAAGGFVVAALMLLLGIAGRYFSLLLIGLLGWYYSSHPMQLPDALLFCAVVWLLLLGSGRFSLWLGDEQWVNRYDGA